MFLNKTKKLIPLTSAKLGMPMRVSKLAGGKDLRGRLYSMGLTPGTPIELVSASGGPVILEVLGSRIMIGRGMASKIMVQLV